MMKRTIAVLVGILMLVAFESTPRCQSPAGPGGHWEGTIETPGQPLKIEVDLGLRSGDNWAGTITIPAQNVKGFQLSDVLVQGTAVSFVMKGVPGTPSFKGTTASDNKSITGNFTQNGATMPFTLAWKGEARFEAPAKSTAITQDVEGTWGGTLDAGGTSLRLTLKLANQEGGATGSLISLDQGGAEIPLTVITQTGSHLKVIVATISGTFEGDLKDGQLTGTWTQGPSAFPLVFSRPAK